jgi:hypothetical protein
LTASVDDTMPNILAFLRDKSLLLLLDNCEHVLDAVPQLAEAVLRSAPGDFDPGRVRAGGIDLVREDLEGRMPAQGRDETCAYERIGCMTRMFER